MIYSPAPLQTPPPAGLPDGLFDQAAANTTSNGEGATPKQSPTASMHRTLSDISAGQVSMPGSTVINLPTPAPSPQPESGRVFGSTTSSSQHLAIWDGRGSPVSPDVSGSAGGADFGERFIDSVVAHYPRLTLPERRKLFTALLPFLQGEDLLHLSQLISPYLRRDFLAELPAEISLHILAFIDDPKDLVRASRVSRTWRSLVSDDHTWKLMLHKYKGRGWAESRVKAPIERIRMKHPEARFGAITSPPAVPRYSQGMYSSGLPSSNGQQSSYFSQHEFQTGSPVRPPTLRRISTLSPTAQPFMYPRPSLSVQTGSSAPGPSSQRSQGLLMTEEDSIEEEEGVNRFLDENQTPLAERRRKLKGKSKGKSSDNQAHNQHAQQASASTSRLPSSASVPDQPPAAWQMQGLGFAARRSSYQPMISPSAPPPRSIGSSLLPPPPQDLNNHFADLSLGSTNTNDSGLSPAARFATVDYSPAAPKSAKSAYLPQYNSTYLTNEASFPRRPPPLSIPSPAPASSKGKAASSYTLPAAPRPRRYIARRSMNPFGVALTTQVAAQQYDDHEKSSPPPFSYKSQFKKAYLTESNWLKGPGRVLCTQTSSDDGVVTSLGFDNDWVVVGMATNQVHVFDAKTGEYARNLHGHTAGVWCLILVSKGGERVDKDGRRVREAYEDSETSEASEREDEEDMPFSHRPQRCRSASARPPDVERFFGSAAGTDSPSLGDEAHSADRAVPDRSTRANTTPLRSPGRTSHQTKPTRLNRNRRPSSFCGLPSASSETSRQSTSSTGFPFADAGNTQQASACGTAAGWGQKGAIAVTAGCDRDIRVWDVETGRCNHILRGHMSTVRCLKVLDGRPIMVSGSRDATLRVWDIEQGTMLRVLAGHQHSVRCIEISGNKVVSGSYDTTCRIWDVDTGECLHLLEGHQHQIYAVAFDGVRVASGSLDSTVRIWSAKTGECLAMLQGHTSLVGQLQLTDSVLVTGGSDGRVIIFSLSTFECLHRLCAHDNSVTCLQFNDRFMVTGGNDGRVKLWDRPSGKLIRELAEPCEAVWRVTFREDKCVLLCKRNGRTVMDVRTFAPHDDQL